MPGILKDRLSQEKDMDWEKEGISEEDKPIETNRHFVYQAPEKEKVENKEYLTEEDISQLDELDAMMAEENFILEKKKQKLFRRISGVSLIIACTYLVSLIYGSFITEFYYNDKGELAPVIMSVNDISNKNEYNSIVGMYLQTRSLYEILLTLDYRMAAGTEDSMAIAPEYESTLDTVSSLTTQIDAAVINSKYTQVKNMLLTWVKTHAAAYCQYMSTAITQNDSNAASEAIAARQVLNDNFQLITQNVITLGEDIKGYDLTDIKEWSPDGYVMEKIEGITSNTTTDTLIPENETVNAETENSTISEEAQEQIPVPEIQSDFSLQQAGGE